ncbi:MAG: hypothetical protein SFV55_04235 [Haliscomenobacter sp.]|uniref:hypothetical protein n=1 Tax=Haliscomenobacter sp. TaxID=2717303 RepID=UPI0029A0CA50|nr:hypothetical protein [Haliscomenobacter sp.]MDX2067609.1 hypothetical protein [Haliscomenobacter sp.]
MAELSTHTMPQPSAKLTEQIWKWIQDLPSSALSQWLYKVCKEQQMLPLHATNIYLWALKLDGQVYCMDHEAFGHPIVLEHDSLACYAALFHGANTYPALTELLPPVPDGAQACINCDGKGWVDSTSSCFACRGLGWHQNQITR